MYRIDYRRFVYLNKVFHSLSRMVPLMVILCLAGGISGLKIWMPNTDINNKFNWDKKDIPKNCDKIRFESDSDVAAFWNLEDVVVSGLSLPGSGDVIFSRNMKIQFRDKDKCSLVRDLKYIRNKIKGWLDPDNWKSDVESGWLPHSERVPCAGEPVRFPPQHTFAVQLPSILVPISDITFDNEVFVGEAWTKFLNTELGYEVFKGPDELRKLPWRTDAGCLDKKKCICGRSSYTIRDGIYKDAHSYIFEEAVCLYAMPKCKSPECYSPVIPEGHCCGVCGAVIKIEDRTQSGLDIGSLKDQVEAELKEQKFEKDLKTYVGRTKDENIQIVVMAENSDDTLKSHVVANLLERKLTDQKLHAKVFRVSGLNLSSYVFNSVSGVVFGTLLAVSTFFISIYYVYMVLPKKKFQRLGVGNPFMFARFDNTLHEGGSEENLEIGVEARAHQEPPQAFDNPMYSANLEPNSSGQNKNVDVVVDDRKVTTPRLNTKEYSNSVYNDLEKREKLEVFKENLGEEKIEEFNDIEL